MTGSRFAVMMLSLIPLATGAAPAPVTDLGGNQPSSSSITPTPPPSTTRSTVGSSAPSRNQGTEFQLELMKQVQQLQTEVSELRGQLEVQNYQIQQLTERQRDLYQELDRRVAAGGAAATTGAAATGAAASSGDAAPAAVPTPPADGKEQQSYEKAVQLVLQDKNYDKAIPAFQKFIKDYPNSSYQPNARYWLCQLLLNKCDSYAAKGQFQKVVSAYPDSPKVPEALLKLGIIAQLDSDAAAAKANYEKVISQYPQSATAQQAKTRLQSL